MQSCRFLCESGAEGTQTESLITFEEEKDIFLQEFRKTRMRSKSLLYIYVVTIVAVETGRVNQASSWSFVIAAPILKLMYLKHEGKNFLITVLIIV